MDGYMIFNDIEHYKYEYNFGYWQDEDQSYINPYVEVVVECLSND